MKEICRKETIATQKKNADVRSCRIAQGQDSAADSVRVLQRTVGNRVVRSLFTTGVLQARLSVGEPHDIYEQEADRVADQVMRMPENTEVCDQRSVIDARKHRIQMKPG